MINMPEGGGISPPHGSQASRRTHPMKHILVGVLVCKPPVYKPKLQPYTLQIQEGTRTCDVLAHLKAKLNWLSDSWVLASASVPTTVFHSEEDLYAAVDDQAKLIVLPSYDAAHITFNKLFPQSFREGMKQ
jgi:hypothetical protein